MASVNKLMIVGRVGRDGELRYSADGKPSLSFSVAVDGWGRPPKTTWFTVKMFGDRTEKLAEFITKGSQLYVEGRHESREYEPKEGGKRVAWELIASDIQLLGSNDGGDRRQQKESDDVDLPFD